LAHSQPWDDPHHDPLSDIFDMVEYLDRNDPRGWETWASIYEPEIEKLTKQLERSGYRVWFTCEVNGTEYRLCARKE